MAGTGNLDVFVGYIWMVMAGTGNLDVFVGYI